GATPPLIEAEGEARLAGDAWQGEARLRVDRVALGDLPQHWPEGLARGARGWLAENLTAGVARDGAWRIGFEGDVATGAARVTGLEGSAEAEDVTVHWLRPIPPAEGVRGRARFALDAITIDVAAGQQSGTGIVVREGSVRIAFDTDPETAEIALVTAGPLADVWALLRHPRLHLFDRRPPPIATLGGTLREGRVQVALPLLGEVPAEAVRVSASGRGTEVRVPRAILGRDIERGAFDFAADTEGLRVSGTATLAGIQLRLTQEADFRPGPPNQVVSRESAVGRADAAQLAGLGLDPRPLVEGQVGIDIRGETRRNGQGRLQLRTDLTPARLAVEPLAWAKAPGVRASGEATIVMQNGALASVDAIRIEAPDTLLRGRAINPRESIPQRIEIQQGNLGRNRFTAEIVPPAGRGGNWTIGMRGPVLDLAPVLAAPPPPVPGAEQAPGPGAVVEARFERMLLAGDSALTGVAATARVDGHGVILAADVRGAVAGGRPFDMRIAQQGGQRRLRIDTEDGGGLLRAFGVLRTVQGGRLAVDATYAHARPNAPLSGNATLEDFAVRDAPALAKLLQAMTVFGVFEALDQRGLSFASLTAPFVLTREALVLNDARAFSVSLGVTAKGRIDRLRETIDMEGTIVPAYVFNSLLGRIPVLGRIFSPEQGGGLFAATYRMRGPLSDPGVTVNPLAALTPGFLRGIFGIGQDAAGTVPEPPR
uniref:AsmA-like C-terminal region-containing protein n=1 Tax=Roseomonas rosulenta TaxID=2748667 RepID=UPI0018DF3CF0